MKIAALEKNEKRFTSLKADVRSLPGVAHFDAIINALEARVQGRDGSAELPALEEKFGKSSFVYSQIFKLVKSK